MLCIESSLMAAREMVVTDCGTSRSNVGVFVAVAVRAAEYSVRRCATTRTGVRLVAATLSREADCALDGRAMVSAGL
jgi:hypothetical protein